MGDACFAKILQVSFKFVKMDSLLDLPLPKSAGRSGLSCQDYWYHEICVVKATDDICSGEN